MKRAVPPPHRTGPGSALLLLSTVTVCGTAKPSSLPFPKEAETQNFQPRADGFYTAVEQLTLGLGG